MAARLVPDHVRRMHQLVADAAWNDEEMLAQVRREVVPTMQKHGPVVAWIGEDTGFPEQGKHSVGVARQYCGPIGKQDNCQAAVSLSVASWNSSLPIAWRLYLPQVWCKDSERRQHAGVPEEIEFQTKPEIALEQIRQAIAQKIPRGVVLADAGYGNGTPFRTAVTERGLRYVAGIESSTSVWESGQQPLAAPPRRPGRGATPKRLPRDAHHQPISVKELAPNLPAAAWKNIAWRPGSQGMLRSPFAAVRVRPAHLDYKRSEPHPQEWLWSEWSKSESEPTKYWLSTLPEKTSLKSLGKMAKQRWIVEGDSEENSSRSWDWDTRKDGVGADFTITPPYVSQHMGSWSPSGTVFPPQPAPAIWDYQPRSRCRTSVPVARRVRPERHNPPSSTTLRILIARLLLRQLPHCPFCGSKAGA
jgi:SRSO17 transposase